MDFRPDALQSAKPACPGGVSNNRKGAIVTSTIRRCGLVLSILTVLFVAGCSSSGGSAKVTATSGSLTVGFIGYNQSVGSAQSQIDATINLMKGEGWTVLTVDPQGNVANANSACVNYTTRGVDVIVVPVFDPSQMGQCVQAAQAAHIPFFYFGSVLGTGAVGAMGTTLAAALNDVFMTKWSGNKDVHILALGLTPAAPCRNRYADFISKWTQAGNAPSQIDFRDMNIQIGTLVDGRTQTAQWLTAHPADKGETLAIWACSGGAASGAVAAMLQANRTNVPVYAWDFTAQESEYVKKGLVTATAWPDTNAMAQSFLKMMKNYFATKKPQGFEEAPYVIITPDTYDKFVADHPGAISK